jgi:methionyl-tRNA formyltransferase
MGAAINVVYLTTDDPLYLPAFFERVFSARADTAAVFVVPPLYKNQSARAAAWRYFRTFGAMASVSLAARTARAKLGDPSFLDRLRGLGTELIVSVSCPQIFRKPLIELAPRGCLNIHGAILPRYRGVMPSFWMLANGEKEAGVSIFFVNEDIDAGELCGQRVFEISEDETLDAFLRRSKTVAAELLVEVLGKIETGSVSQTPLDLSKGSYYSWPAREDVRRFRAAGRRVF